MATQSNFRSIVNNLAQWCSSRNHDFDGYWAMGVLYSAAKQAKESSLIVDVLNQKANLPSNTTVKLCNDYQKLVFNEMAALKMRRSSLMSLQVCCKFDYLSEIHHNIWRSNCGDPYLVEVQLSTATNRLFCGYSAGYCYPYQQHRGFRR